MTYQLTTLSDGLRIASEFLPGLETVSLSVSYAVGARHEEPNQHGMAHLLEHMAFKGTKRRSARQIAEEFDDIGGHINAYTSMEQTVYYARVLAQHLPVAVEILADILQHSVFDAKELEREKEVIVQEIGMHQDSPDDLVFDYLHDVIYPDQPLGRTILGTPESVRSFMPDDIQAYVNRHYHTPAMVISAAGNIRHAQLEALIATHFNHLQSRPVIEIEPSHYQGGHKAVSRDLEQLQVMLAVEGIAIQDEDYIPAQLLSTILGGGMSSRLFQEIREKQGLAYTVQSFLTTYRDSGFFGIYAATGEEEGNALLASLAQEVTRLCQQGVESRELERAKNQQKSSILMRRESSGSVSESIARHLQDYGEYRTAEYLIAQIEKIQPDDLHRVAMRLFKQPKLSLATLGPQKGLKPLSWLEEQFS